MREMFRRTVVDDHALVQHEDRVVERQVREAVGDVDDDAFPAAVGAGKRVEQSQNLVRAAGV